MKLSDAIRLGSTLKPKGTGAFGNNRTCALGAAAEAAGIKKDFNELELAFPILGKTGIPCPDCGKVHVWIMIIRRWGDLSLTITILNDVHGWSRERIAGWVASVEPTEPPPSEQPEPEHQEEELTHA